MYFSHYLTSSKFEAANEIIAKVQEQFAEIKMAFEDRDLSKKKKYTSESLLIRAQ